MNAGHLLAVPDKFRGTATARDVAATMARAAEQLGWTAEAVPVADGGEGLLDCFGGANRSTEVTGPLRTPVHAGWRLDGRRAVIEMAAASGLALTEGRNDPIAATTTGTGELVLAALQARATEIIVGAGGSATTDGGRGAVEVLRAYAPLDGSRGYRVQVATDVTTLFLDAAEVFAPQKGAGLADVAELAARLRSVAAQYLDEFGVDVRALPGGGAAGGLAGGLAALGAGIRPGFALISEELDLPARMGRADLVLTGEGSFDATSGLGKATGGVLDLARRLGKPAALVVGRLADDIRAPVPAVSLVARFGEDRAVRQTLDCVAAAVGELLDGPAHFGPG